MSDVLIQVENLWKQYRIGVPERYSTLRDKLAEAVRWPFQAVRDVVNGNGRPRTEAETFWALREVSFEVRQGEVLGVIGRNGAGKSTLLKVLSRITDPTRGRVEIRGRVGSLLEVGTGFHPELTGRENVSLNGAILGMRKAEIEKKFDEIVAFAEVEKFIDTPVKHYSSGMYLRLAFAVAAHLEPEILIVDEVLAVGDASFQKKCLGKMGEVAKQGRTVLFVSHNMTAIESLCARCVLLREGSVQLQAEPRDVIRQYMEEALCAARSDVHDLRQHSRRASGSRAVMTELRVRSAGASGSVIRMGEPLSVEVKLDRGELPFKPILGIVIKTASGMPVLGVNNRFIPMEEAHCALSRGLIRARFENLPLMPGTYLIDLYIGDEHHDFDVIQEAAAFEVTPADVFGSGKLPPASVGPLCWPASFEVVPEHVAEIASPLLHK